MLESPQNNIKDNGSRSSISVIWQGIAVEHSAVFRHIYSVNNKSIKLL